MTFKMDSITRMEASKISSYTAYTNKSLDAANETAREIYDDRLEELGDDADTIEDKLKRGMATILVEDRNEETTDLITVEKMHLQ